jgi:acetyl-CoA C-acetyltransferase
MRSGNEAVPDTTPVLVGVGQLVDRIDDPAYRPQSPVELAARAAALAIADTDGRADAVRSAVDVVAGVRQFEISVPGAATPLGCSDNYPRSVTDRLGVNPANAILDVSGGQSPQQLITELAATISRGGATAALVFGAEAVSTVRRFAGNPQRPDFTERRGGQLDDRGFGLKGLITRYAAAHDLTDAASQYALFENARRAKVGVTRDEYARSMGDLFAPFSAVAASNPYAASRQAHSPAELIAVTERNRLIADPYPRFLVARDQVNQGAAALLMSVDAARRTGVPAEKWVYLHGHADLREVDLLRRPDLAVSPASVRAVTRALDVAGIDLATLDLIDLYSCFPISVFNICDGVGLAPDDPRGLTVTGGLPYFGGPGNNYSLHAIAEMVQRLRASAGSYGLVGANGGTMSKYSAGVYSTAAAPWRGDSSAVIQHRLDAGARIDYQIHADGEATIETYTRKDTRNGPIGIIVGRLADGSRALATTAPGDGEVLALLGTEQPIGQPVMIRSTGPRNVVSTCRHAGATITRPSTAALDGGYEHITVTRDGRILEVTINRPEARNALTPDANAELERVFDAYFDEPTLWVAILTGAGTQSFCAGNDLRYTASGKRMWIPKTGFAGLTSRRYMDKPVIAAVNGYAMGGGFEIALACHLVVADADAKFALSEVRVGLVAGAGGLIRLPRMLPVKLANELILTGRVLDAREAADHGLINKVAEPGEALTAARDLAHAICSGSPTSVRISLQIMNDSAGMTDPIDALDQTTEHLDELVLSADMFEGVSAFAAKRAPQWKNR